MTPAQCRAARALLDWSQQQLADGAGVGVVTVRQFEAGAASPRNATTEVLMNTLEKAGVKFLAGSDAGPGVQSARPLNPLEQFLLFLKVYEHNRLRVTGIHRHPLPEFGYGFVYHNREGANLMFKAQEIGRVRWRDGTIEFDPPLPNGRTPTLTDEAFDAWVAQAEYRRVTTDRPT
jgi:transcriptional regulator with XRE-family HTH domain